MGAGLDRFPVTVFLGSIDLFVPSVFFECHSFGSGCCWIFCHSIKRLFLFGQRLQPREFSAIGTRGYLLLFPFSYHPYPSHLHRRRAPIYPTLERVMHKTRKEIVNSEGTIMDPEGFYIYSTHDGLHVKKESLYFWPSSRGWAAISYLYTSMMAGSVVKVTLSLSSTRNFIFKTYEKTLHEFNGGFEIGWGSMEKRKSNSDSSRKNYFRNSKLVLEKSVR